MVTLLRAWILLVAGVMLLYAVRHWTLTWVRLARRQRTAPPELGEAHWPPLTVLVPMHNEEAVAAGVLDALVASDYPRERLEVIPIDDHSEDGTAAILDHYAAMHPFIKPLHRHLGQRGKPAGLNDALLRASHEIVLVFDADYQPPPHLLRRLAAAFSDPEVGAVMGRVVPRNSGVNLLTRLLELERAGGYQVDQQGRFTLDLVPQYGGTVGGFRRSLVQAWGGFDPRILAEDTELTLRLYTHGFTVAYVNAAECYEEVPETWEVRFRQLRRWARGHTQVLLAHAGAIPRSPYLTRAQKADALLLLGIYLVPPLLVSATAASLLLFLAGAIPAWELVLVALFTVTYNAFGNFAPFFQVAAAGVLDGMGARLRLVPLLLLVYLYNTWAVSAGIVAAITDVGRRQVPAWEKTDRFRR